MNKHWNLTVPLKPGTNPFLHPIWTQTKIQKSFYKNWKDKCSPFHPFFKLWRTGNGISIQGRNNFIGYKGHQNVNTIISLNFWSSRAQKIFSQNFKNRKIYVLYLLFMFSPLSNDIYDLIITGWLLRKIEPYFLWYLESIQTQH